jgi:hypothetical protein
VRWYIRAYLKALLDFSFAQDPTQALFFLIHHDAPAITTTTTLMWCVDELGFILVI